MSSNVIENQVVQMEFDNKNFEKNVHLTINSVKELRDSLNFGSEASTSLVSSLNAINLSKLSAGLDAISDRFSTFGIVGMTAIQRITNAVINLGVTMEQRLTGVLTTGWNQIITGGTNRAANIEQATFQLEGLFGKEIEGQNQLKMAMTGTADEIKRLTGYTEDMIVADNAANYAVADTAYGLDSAAKAASQLAASGVDVIAYHEDLADSAGHMRTEMQVALRAISGTAAMTNSDYDSMAHIFATVAGNGRLMSEQLNSLGSRGLNAAATIAKYFREVGIDANATEKTIREMVSNSEIDFMTFAKAMDSAYGEHAKDANSTFTGAFSNMKFALSKIGADFIAPLRDDLIPVLNNVRMAFNAVRASLTPFLNAFKNSSHYLTDKLLEKFASLIGYGESDSEWKGSDQWNVAIENITNVVQLATDILSNFLIFANSVVKPINEAWKELFPSRGYSGLVAILNKVKEFTSDLRLTDDAMEKLKNTARGIFSIVNIAKQIVTPIINGIKELLRYFGILDADILGLTSDIGDALYDLSESGVIGEKVQGIVDKIVEFIKKISETIKETDAIDVSNFSLNLTAIIDTIKEFFGSLIGSGSAAEAAWKVVTLIGSVIKAVGDVLSNIKNAFISDPDQVSDNLISIGEATLVAVGLIKILDGLKNVRSIDSALFKQLIISIVTVALSLVVLSSIDPNKLVTAALTIGTLFFVLATSFRIISNGFQVFNANLVNIAREAKGIKGFLQASFAAQVTTVFDSLGAFAKQLGASLMVGSIAASVYLLVKGIVNIVNIFKDLRDSLGYSESDSIALLILSMIVTVGLIFGVLKMYEKMVSHIESVDTKSQIKVAVAITALAGLVKELTDSASTFSKFTSFTEWVSALSGLTAVIGAFWGIYTVMEKSNMADIDENAKLLISIAITLAVLMKSVSSVAKMASSSTEGLMGIWTASGILIGIVGLIGALVYALNKCPANDSTIKSLTAIGIVIGMISLLGFTITQLAKFDWKQLLVALIPVGAVLVAVLALAGMVTLIPGMEMGMFAFAAAIAAIGIAVAGIGAGLYLGAAAIHLLIEAIIDLGEAWRDNGPNIIEGMTQVLSKIAGLLPEFISSMVEGFVKGLKENMDKITALAPYISTFIGRTLVGIIQTLANNIGPLTDAILGLIINLVNAVGTRIPDIFGAIKNIILPILDGVLGLLAGLFAAIAEGGGEILGRMIGGMVDGLTKALSKVSFTDFAKELANFMLELQPFIDGLKGLDESTMRAALMLAEVITIITADNILRSLTSWFAGGNSLENFGKQLAAFGPYIKQYAEDVSGIDVAAVEASTRAATMIAEFANKIPNEGGLLAKVVGDNDIKSFGEKLSEFGPYIRKYSDDVAGIDVAAVEASTNAAQMIADFANTIPNEGGLIARITGDNDISTFGSELKDFGKYISDYSDEVKDIDAEAVETSVNAALMITEFADAIPNTGGIKAIFEGDNAVDQFGKQLAEFGKYIVLYYNNISEIDSYTMSETADALATLFKVLGQSDKVTKGSVDNLRDILEAVAEIGISGFLKKISDDSDSDIKDAIDDFFDKVKEGFKNKARLVGLYAEEKGRALVAAYVRGINNSLDDVREASKSISAESVKAMSDAIDDPLYEPAGASLLVGESEGYGLYAGLEEWKDPINLLSIDIADGSLTPFNLETDFYNQGHNNATEYFRGLMNASNANSDITNAFIPQHEGYYNPNAIALPKTLGELTGGSALASLANRDKKVTDDAAKSTELMVEQMLNYQRAQDNTNDSMEDAIDAYSRQAEEALKASRANDQLSKSTSGAGGSASKAKTEFEKLTDKIDNLMQQYSEMWDDAKERANKNLFKGLDENGDDFLSGVQNIMDQYENIFTSAVQRTNEQDLFEEVKKDANAFAPETLINNLQDQVDQINELNTIIASLSGRVADENLRAAISNMDVDQLPQLRALYRMSAGQLSDYERLYQDKVAANQSKIQNELTGSLSQLTGEYTNVASYVATDQSTQIMLANMQAQIDKLNEYNDTVASLMSKIEDVNLREAIANMGSDSLSELKTLDSMTRDELNQYVSMYNDIIVGEAKSIESELSTQLSSLLGMPIDIQPFYENYDGTMESIINYITGNGNAAYLAGSKIAELMGKGLGESLSGGAGKKSMNDAGESLGGSLSDGLSSEDTVEKVKTSTEMLVSTFFSTINMHQDETEKLGKAIVMWIARGIDFERKLSFESQIFKLIDSLKPIFDAKSTAFFALGANMMVGMIRGIKSNVSKLTQAASDAATSALNAAKQALDSHSPSREFIKLGQFMDEGLAIGLRHYSSLASDASTTVAENSLSAVQEAINQLSGMLDGSIDVNPVITPTLDLSEVNARSAALANMFNGRQIAVQARNDEQQAEMITKLGNVLAQQNSEPRTITFNQTNNSPKALSRTEIYRQSRNAFSQLANAIS